MAARRARGDVRPVRCLLPGWSRHGRLPARHATEPVILGRGAALTAAEAAAQPRACSCGSHARDVMVGHVLRLVLGQRGLARFTLAKGVTAGPLPVAGTCGSQGRCGSEVR